MDRAMKESFYEANVRVEEEFASVKKAHLSNKHGDNAKVEVLDLKFDNSRIKLKQKEQTDDRSKKDIGNQVEDGRRISKNK